MQPTEPNIKKKNQSPMRIIVNRWGFLFGFFMLGLGVAMGLLAAVFVGPQLLGFDVTATALMDREIMLAATSVDLHSRAQDADSQATSFALDVQSTQAILNNNADLLNQTATRSSQNIIATTTASAIQSSQRQTQVANDFVSTQAALNANATQVELDFRNTQAALGIGSAQSDNNLASTPLSRYTFDFGDYNTSSAVWELSDTAAWQTTGASLLASNDGAWLIEAEARILNNYDFENFYTIDVTISPATVLNADYWVLLGIGDEAGYAAYFNAQTLAINEVALYSFDLSQLEDGLSTSELTVVQRNAAAVNLNGETHLQVEIDGESVSLLVDDEIVLKADDITIESGAIGVQLPEGASLISIGVGDQ